MSDYLLTQTTGNGQSCVGTAGCAGRLFYKEKNLRYDRALVYHICVGRHMNGRQEAKDRYQVGSVEILRFQQSFESLGPLETLRTTSSL